MTGTEQAELWTLVWIGAAFAVGGLLGYLARSYAKPDPALASVVLDAVDSEIAVIDQAGAVITINARWRDVLAAGDDPDALVAVTVGDNIIDHLMGAVPALTPEQIEIRDALRASLTGEITTYQQDYALLSSDTRLWYRMSLRRLSNGLVVLDRSNETASHRIEAALRESEQNLRTLLDATTDIVVMHDLSGRIQVANKPAARQLRLASSRIGGRDIFDCLPDDVQQSRRFWFDRLIATGYAVRFEENWSGKWFDTTMLPISGSEGFTVGVAMFSRDITAQRNYQEALAHAKEDAENASAAKTRFLAAASHDLRQPIQAMNMFIDLLDRRISTPEEQDYIDSVKLSLAVLANLLNTLLDISKLDAQMIAVNPQVVELDGLLNRLREQFQPVAEVADLDLQVMPCSEQIWGDPFLLERVLNNLVSNALSYTEEGRVLVGCRHQGNHIKIQIWDSGIGIDQENLGKIYEEFYQVGNPERDRRKGLGLGLSIVKRLTDLMAIPIRVRSEPGRGTMFELFVQKARDDLLVDQVHAAGEPQNEAKPKVKLLKGAEHSGLLIVAIDDEPSVLRGLSLLLIDNGYEVIAAASPKAAIQALTNNHADRMPDLVLADYRLSHGLTGTQAIQQLSEALGRELPGIILTGDTSPERLVEARQSGFPVLHKPLTAEEVGDAITEALEKVLV